MKRLLSRSILILLVLGAGALIAFGPRPEANLPKDRVVVSYWEKWTTREAEQMQQVVTDFNNSVGKEKGIFVQYLSISTIEKKTMTSTAAGVPPDVAGLYDRNVTPYSLENALEPLDDLAREYGIKESDYKPVYWKICTNTEGKLYALPSTPSCVALHYNKRVFWRDAAKLRAAGLDPTRPPRMLDEFDHYAKVLDIKSPDGKMIRAGHLPMEPGYWANVLGLWFGGNIWNESDGHFTLNTLANRRAFEWVAGYSKRFGADAMSEFRSGFGTFGTPQNPFYTESVVMVQQGPWVANYTLMLDPEMSQALVPTELEIFLPRVARPFNYYWEAAPFPTAIPGLKDVTNCVCDVLCIPRGARHKREAFEFIAYVQRQKVMEKLCSSHSKNSPLAEVSDTFALKHVNPFIQVFEDLSDSPNATLWPRTAVWTEASDELNAMTQRIYLLQQTPEQALAQSQRRLDAMVVHMTEREQRRAEYAGQQ